MKKRFFGILLMGAMVVASMSMFTSCKDYDDDIKKNSDDIAALRTELTSLRTSLTSDLSTAVSALETKLGNKLDVAALANYNFATKEDLAKALNNLSAEEVQKIADAAAQVSAIETQIAAIDQALEDNNIAEMATTIATLNGDMKELEERLAALEGAETGISEEDAKAIAEAAVKANLETQNKALEDLEKRLMEAIAANKGEGTGTATPYDDTKLKEQLAALGTDIETVKADLQKAIDDAVKAKNDEIKALQDAVKALEDAKFASKAEMETAMTNLSAQISAQIPNVDVLTALVNKILTSVTLIPQTYIDGIEAIQFVSVKYIAKKFYRNGAEVPNTGGFAALVPNNYADATNDIAEVWPTATYYTTPGTTPGFDPQTGAWDIIDHNLYGIRKADGTCDEIRIDNGETEAYYRLSPAVVKEEEIDTENLEFECTNATTITRDVNLRKNNPVEPIYKSLANGVLTVNLRKTVQGNIRFAGEGANATIASLKVPRKANAEKGVEAADIYSEFNLLDETVVEPRIAALNRANGNYTYAFNTPSIAYSHSLDRPMTYHFIDSLHIWKSQVDCADATPGNVSGYLYVKECMQYNEPFDLMKLVTGCYEIGGAHNELTKDQLKKYGIAFRFAIPSTEYAGTAVINQNSTNQQVFAKLSGYANNILESQLPQSHIQGNRAIIGKEPIIRVMMIDTVNKKLIDQAYFKMKFVDGTPNKDKIEVTFNDQAELDCNFNRMVIRWDKFIERVYAQIGDDGLSWDEFRAIYPKADVVRVNANNTTSAFANNAANTGIEQGNIGPASLDDPLYATWAPTNGKVEIYFLDPNPAQTSPDADANKLYWILGPADIATIDLGTRQKTFTTKVRFVSNQPRNYGNVEVTLNYTITLPQKPKIYGFYDNYWFEKYETVDVLPVQYLTKSYFEQLIGDDYLTAFTTGAPVPTAGKVTADNGNYAAANGLYSPWVPVATTPAGLAGADGGYCVYNNNMLNAFTYKHSGATNVNDRVYNDGTYNCEKWDFQFRLLDQTQGQVDYKNCVIPGATAGTWVQEHTTEPLFNVGAPDLYINGGAGYDETTAPHDAYAFQTKIGTVWGDAIWFNWMNTADDSNATPAGTERMGVKPSAQSAWQHDGTVAPYLFADHNNPNNQLLINPISASAVGQAPTRTHDKKIGVGVFYAYNDWNAESIKNYNICLVAPLCISDNFSGYFEEGLVSGSFVNCRDAFTMIDFRGYEVKNQAVPAALATNEFVKYRQDLYKYYEVTPPVYDLANVRYGFKKQNNNIVADDNIEPRQLANGNWSGGMTAAEIQAATNGNVILSIDQVDPTGAASVDYLRFKNNGGSNVEEHVNVFVPCTITYGFGTITKYVKIRLHPRENDAAHCNL